jgi:hypothetical protein
MPQSRVYNPFVNTGGGGSTIDPIAREIAVIDFNYSDPSPKNLITLPAGTKILNCKIIITQIFNSPTATLKIGDSGVDDRFMQASQNFPDELAEYHANIFYELPSSTTLLLTLNPSGATQGQGKVVIIYKII